MSLRHEYVLRLAQYSRLPTLHPSIIGDVRPPAPSDQAALAELMLDAYRHTIDDGGETIDDARNEVDSFFTSASTPPLLTCSWVYWRETQAVAACLASWWPQRHCALIAYVMTRAAAKGLGLGRYLVQRSLECFVEAGYHEARAVITGGNTNNISH